MKRELAALIVVAATLGACEEPRPPVGVGGPSPTASERPPGPDDATIKKRTPSAPRKLLVINAGLGSGKRMTRHAIADLKRMGFWDDLTGHLFALKVSTRPGFSDIPEDGRLGDSFWTYYRDERTGALGDLCDVLLFSAAIENDVGAQQIYYEQGRLGAPPPTVPQFWTVILAHEIAHCSRRGQKGEVYSTAWEGRVIGAYGIDRVGSP